MVPWALALAPAQTRGKGTGPAWDSDCAREAGEQWEGERVCCSHQDTRFPILLQVPLGDRLYVVAAAGGEYP